MDTKTIEVKLQKKECKKCGKEFFYYRSKSKGRTREYCSDECRKVFKKCVQCGFEYEGNHRSKYCCKKCAGKAKHENRRVIICKGCGKYFKPKIGSMSSFCSDNCKPKQKSCAYCGKHIQKENGQTYVKVYCSPVCRAKAIKNRAKERAKENQIKKRQSIAKALRMWRKGQSFDLISEVTGYRSISGLLNQSKAYRRISQKRMKESEWRRKETKLNAKSSMFKKEEDFRKYAAKELKKHFPCVMQEVSIPESRRKIDLVVEDGLFRFGIELKNGNRTAGMDQALGQALLKCSFLGGLSPVVAVPDDIEIDDIFLTGCKKLGVIAGTLSQVIQQISIKCYDTSAYVTP